MNLPPVSLCKEYRSMIAVDLLAGPDQPRGSLQLFHPRYHTILLIYPHLIREMTYASVDESFSTYGLRSWLKMPHRAKQSP